MDDRLATLPDLLITQSGQRVEMVQQWREGRRSEILELFRTHVYGRAPRPLNVSFQTKEQAGFMDGTALRKQVDINFTGAHGQGTIPLLMFLPAKRTGPVPLMLLINNRMQVDPEQIEESHFWPAKKIIERGYAAAVYDVSDLDPDEHDGFRNGVHGIFESPHELRSPDAWGAIGAWAWGASRVMDYLESDSDIDASRVSLVGHSRGGKAALWAGAQDERFAMVVSNNSGSTGAAIARGKRGETVADINTRFPHWFTENYKQFNYKESQLPVDQHMLLALIAPRLLYVTSASEDEWADPQSEFLSLKLAESAYELYEHSGLAEKEFPHKQMAYHGDRTAYHLREGKHDLTVYDWLLFMEFFGEKI